MYRFGRSKDRNGKGKGKEIAETVTGQDDTASIGSNVEKEKGAASIDRAANSHEGKSSADLLVS